MKKIFLLLSLIIFITACADTGSNNENTNTGTDNGSTTEKTDMEKIAYVFDNAIEKPAVDLTAETGFYYRKGQDQVPGYGDDNAILYTNLPLSTFHNPVLNIDSLLFQFGYTGKKIFAIYDYSEELFFIRESSVKPCSGIVSDTLYTYDTEQFFNDAKNEPECAKMQNKDFSLPSVASCTYAMFNKGIKPIKYKWTADTDKLSNYTCK